MKDITNVINYLETAINLKSEYSDFLSKIGIEDPIINITNYIIDNDLITSSLDILELSTRLPSDIVELIAKKYDEHQKKIYKVFKEKYEDKSNSGYLFSDLLV